MLHNLRHASVEEVIAAAEAGAVARERGSTAGARVTWARPGESGDGESMAEAESGGAETGSNRVRVLVPLDPMDVRGADQAFHPGSDDGTYAALNAMLPVASSGSLAALTNSLLESAFAPDLGSDQ